MLLSKIFGKSKEIPLEKEFEFNVYNMKNYHSSIASCGKLSRVYASAVTTLTWI